jgi:hypothetical protein
MTDETADADDVHDDPSPRDEDRAHDPRGVAE